MESVSPCSELQWFPEKKTDSELPFPGASTISMLLSITGSYIYHTSTSAGSKLCGVGCITKRTGKDIITTKAIDPVRNTDSWNSISTLKTEPAEFSVEKSILRVEMLRWDLTDLYNTLQNRTLIQ